VSEVKVARPRRRDVLVAGAGAVPATAAAPASKPPLANHGGAGRDVDIHCHSFCSADLPIVGFVAHHIPGLVELSRFVTKWPEVVVRALLGVVAQLPNAAAPTGPDELASLQKELASPSTALLPGVYPIPSELYDDVLAALCKKLPFEVGPEKRQLLSRYLDALYVAAHPRAAIAATMAETYRTVGLFTPSLVDYDAWSDDNAPTPLATQILIQESIARLSVRGRIGRADARLHPFVAFDPRRQAEAVKVMYQPSALDLVSAAIDHGGFLGVKIYPPVGFAPLDNARLRAKEPLSPKIDDALRALYAFCEAEEVPITTHASAANEYALGLRQLVAPERWRPALEAAPGLRLNLGHFGHDYGVIGPGSTAGWIHQGAALVERFPNVYADLANSPLVYDTRYAARFVTILREVVARHPKVKRRLMYGSDWWLAKLDPDAGLAAGRFRSTLAAVLTSDEVDDVMGRNALRFLGLLDDANKPRSGKAAARLRRFYASAGVGGAGAPLPPWLPPS
jgi:predicted TIM-barrel fold metal-dependent hydrolase